jgi:hypothetical protein
MVSVGRNATAERGFGGRVREASRVFLGRSAGGDPLSVFICYRSRMVPAALS